MILQSLHDLYDRLAADPSYEIAKPGYSPQKISFRVVIKPDGSLFDIQDARILNEKGKLYAETQLVIGEGKSAGPGINPGFLWENTAYLLGYKPGDDNPERTVKSFEAFRDKHLALEDEINLPDFSSVCRFLESWTPEKASEFAELNPAVNELTTGFGLIQIQGQPVPINAHPAILKWWDAKSAQEIGELGQCLITGEHAPIARLHPKIKSVAGAQSAGASIVSFNAPSYESYGKEQSFNAPVSEAAAFRYGTALNSLLNGPMSDKHRIRIGDTTCVFWTDQPSVVEDAFSIFSSSGSEAQDQATRSKLEVFLKSLRVGTDVLENLGENPTQNRFYILGLAPNAARLSVRFFHQSTVADFLQNLRVHHADTSIVRQFETTIGKRQADPEFIPNWQFLRETARVSDEIPPLLGGALMRSILENIPYPEGIYSAVIRRIRADRTINYPRAAIIKGTLVRNHNQTIPVMLDPENTEPAYLLGRLFATLEKIQEEGNTAQTGGKLDSTIRDRYLSSACATPSAVFPRLETLSTHHRRHLNPGRKAFFDKLVGEIKWNQSGTKSTHTLKEQGMFILGYYHQRKALFTAKEKSEQEPATTEQSA